MSANSTSSPKWTATEFREFADLVDDINAPGFGNPRRPIGRSRMAEFVAKHGKEKCDAMFAVLEGQSDGL